MKTTKEQLYFDPVSCIYFRASDDIVEDAVTYLNKYLDAKGAVTLDEYLGALGLEVPDDQQLRNFIVAVKSPYARTAFALVHTKQSDYTHVISVEVVKNR